jgi:hypothetical protein
MIYIKIVEHFQVRLVKNIVISILFVPRSQENSIDSEEWPKLRIKIKLFDIGS